MRGRVAFGLVVILVMGALVGWRLDGPGAKEQQPSPQQQPRPHTTAATTGRARTPGHPVGSRVHSVTVTVSVTLHPGPQRPRTHRRESPDPVGNSPSTSASAVQRSTASCGKRVIRGRAAGQAAQIMATQNTSGTCRARSR